jgi:hypothetical protein
MRGTSSTWPYSMGDTLISTTCGLRDAVPSVLNLLLD